MLNLILTALEYPIVARFIKSTIESMDRVWKGHTHFFTQDDVVPVWHTRYTIETRQDLQGIPDVPDFHPFSLQYMTYLFCYYLGTLTNQYLLEKETLRVVSQWTPFIPNVFEDIIIVYYSRGGLWTAYVNNETDWKVFQDTLIDWISEHKGKQDSDATWNILTIHERMDEGKESETLVDSTKDLFLFMSPDGRFVSRDHLERLTSCKIVLETMEGNRIDI